jgi:hypothetical protein
VREISGRVFIIVPSEQSLHYSVHVCWVIDGDNINVFRLYRQHSQQEASPIDHEQEVRVLVAGTKSKKSNRRNIVEQAQGRAATCEYFRAI